MDKGKSQIQEGIQNQLNTRETIMVTKTGHMFEKFDYKETSIKTESEIDPVHQDTY